ncbi:hypothetical protein DM01DRAFT_1336786 [Hesseltinella vesiculosa]|uniref:Zinc finger Mcm10/DnaG-type domain-containing protein n=1 Tax=Hesseltinella vesiculosa TaxID=101127 RepID=A0A1X2GF80_9FUNG|nr:hypothetical protein DM01DRAFT_1336786 [Hesseltinella vesiculosa]
MRGYVFYVFFSGKAADQFKNKIRMGSIVGFTKPTILRPGDVDSAVGLHVAHLYQVWLIGTSKDLGQCEAYVNNTTQCPATLDQRSGTLCDKHLVTICGKSKNTRMEFASGDSGLEIGWATTKLARNGQTKYQRMDVASQASKNMNKTFTYVIPGKGPINTLGKLIRKEVVQDPKKVAKEKKAWTQFLEGRSDPGAMMIRKLKGIEEKEAVNVLSKEAFLKIHNKTPMEKEEAQAKKRSIDMLLAQQQRKKAKKLNDEDPKFVYL